MGIPGTIHGFSKLSREDQINLVSAFSKEPAGVKNELLAHRFANKDQQDIYDGFSENTVSNFFLPYSIAPNFMINERLYLLPMVTEESSVVAAAAWAAKYWSDRGGFHTRVVSMNKPGYIHFIWKGSAAEITTFVNGMTPGFLEVTSFFTRNMKTRGGGIQSIQLIDLSDRIEGYYQIEVVFNTADSMGANFINSCLESMTSFMREQVELAGISDRLTIILSVLSNYTPQCTVECSVNCHPDRLSQPQNGLKGMDFARKFEMAVNIARVSISRAVTHNKGIYNGIDAVIIATGNDFRAVEADGHAYAARKGNYSGLTTVELFPDSFTCKIEVPMSIGTVGGLTRSHPMVRVSMKILGEPDAAGLMSIASAAGLANNFSAVRALITEGIQHGHMHLHLSNLLQQLKASAQEKEAAENYFKVHPVSHASVEEFLKDRRAGTQDSRI
jgi:hydroxymethylglutaryl-CoA reductase